MKKVLGGAIALGVAAMLSAAPQNPQTGTPGTNQPVHTATKPTGKHTGKKHGARHNGHSTRKGKTQSTTVKPGN